MIVVHVLSFLSGLLGAGLMFWKGHWAGPLVGVSLVIFFNSVAIDLELKLKKSFGGRDPFTRVAAWICVSSLLSLIGYIGYVMRHC